MHARKTYRERGQSEERAHLGLLEKKKDYKERARDFHKKQDAIQALQKKAAFRNPDEFYHRMEKSKKKDGKHVSLEKDLEPTLAEKLNLQTSDIAYLRMRRTMEGRKVEQMKGRLAMARDLDADELKSKHTVFVDTPEEAEAFDEEEYFDTHQDYVTRAYNRPSRKALDEGNQTLVIGAQGRGRSSSAILSSSDLSKGDLKRLERQRSLAYGELSARLNREEQLDTTLDRLQLRHNLHKDSNVTKIKRAGKVIYKWRPQRKR